MAFHVDIVTPEALAFTGEVLEVRVPGWEGQMGVLPGHEQYLTLLRGGLTTVVTPTETLRFLIGRGFAEVGTDRVTVLTDSLVPADEVDTSGAKARYDQIERSLTELNAADPAWEVAEEQLEIALGRLQIH